MKSPFAATLDQVVELTSIPDQLLRQWAISGAYEPTISNQPNQAYGRVYSFEDVVNLRLLAVLRKEMQLSDSTLQRIGILLRDAGEDEWLRIAVAIEGQSFRVVDVGTAQEKDFVVSIQTVLEEVNREIDRMRRRTPDEVGRIEQNRHIAHNSPVLAGTRVRTSAIWSFHQAGYSTEEILQEYPRLLPADIDAAIAFERDRQAQLAN